jgi:hypothetical protein
MEPRFSGSQSRREAGRSSDNMKPTHMQRNLAGFTVLGLRWSGLSVETISNL